MPLKRHPGQTGRNEGCSISAPGGVGHSVAMNEGNRGAGRRRMLIPLGVAASALGTVWWLSTKSGPRRAHLRKEPNVADEQLMGPVSYLIVEFPGSKMTGEGFPILVDLVNRGVIRILDLRFITKDVDGAVRGIQLSDIDRDGQVDLAVFEGASSGLIDESDFADASSVIEPGSSAGILIFENRWASPFVDALRRGGAELVAAGYIPQDLLIASLDATEPARSLLSRGGDHARASTRSSPHRGGGWYGHSRFQPRFAAASQSLVDPRRGGLLRATAVRPTSIRTTPVRPAGSPAPARPN
jgi:hypothetical protein